MEVKQILKKNDFLKLSARAPLRIGLAGGGTDIKSYFDFYSGATLNAAINKYAYAEITNIKSNFVAQAADHATEMSIDEIKNKTKIPKELRLHFAVYKRIIEDFNNSKHLKIKLSTFCDAPIGSGLGSSSTLVVAILKAFDDLLDLKFDKYFIAELAYKIEREDCQLSGGKQDQYSASFGGFNFIKFQKEKTIVESLNIQNFFKCELETSLILHFTGLSRSSSEVISDQERYSLSKDSDALNCLHQIKEEAYRMKKFILNNNKNGIMDSLNQSWIFKKKTSKNVSNKFIEDRIKLGFEYGANAAKVSGAGGGGFILFMTEPNKGIKLRNRLLMESSETFFCGFNSKGVESWIMK